MIDGTATRDFHANDITRRFSAIRDGAAADRFDIDQIPKLGVSKNLLPNGCRNEDGSYVFTDLPSLKDAQPASFEVTLEGSTYSGLYHGLAAIKADRHGDLEKFAAAGFQELRRDGKVLFKLDQPADLFITRNNGSYEAVIDDGGKTVKPRLETP